jgi:hypothetical protein
MTVRVPRLNHLRLQTDLKASSGQASMVILLKSSMNASTRVGMAEKLQ